MRYSVIFFSNGNTAVFDESGEQVQGLQQPWILKFVEFLEANGIDPLACEFALPNLAQARLFKTSEGEWNWKVGI